MSWKDLSFEQKVHNAFGSQEVELVQATHSYLHAASRSYEEWAYFWSKRDDGSWAHAWGRMRGWDEIWYGNVANYDANCYGNYLKIFKLYPEVGGMDPRPLMVLSMHTLASGIVEVAEDGMSARAAFYTPGTLGSIINDDGKPGANSLWERYGADYVLEDGKWLFLHQQVCPDIMGDFDNVNTARNSYLMETGGIKPPDFGSQGQDDPLGYHIPPRTDEYMMHFGYSVVQTVQNSVPWPESYKTLDDDNTYTAPVLKS